MTLNNEVIAQLIASLVTIIAVLALLFKQSLPNKKNNKGNPTKYDLSDFVNDCTRDHAVMIEQNKTMQKTLERIEGLIGKS